MQTIAEVQAACDRLAALMVEKGVVRPSAILKVRSDEQLVVILSLGLAGSTWDSTHEFFRGADASLILGEAKAFIAALPTPDERHRAEFLTLAGKAADYAAAHLPGDEIATQVRATIVAGMKRLSENALTAA